MIVTIHQPEFLPWLGFLDKAVQADLFILLDHVPVRKRYFHNRNQIRTANGAEWVVVPMHSSGWPPINEVRISNEFQAKWAHKIWSAIKQNYGPSPHFERYGAGLQALLGERWERLVDLNEALIRYLFDAYGIGVTLIKSSEFGLKSRKGDLMRDLSIATGATTYLSGVSGESYLDLPSFERAGIDVRFQQFFHPIYPQRYEPFLPCMSCIDLLFQSGPESLEVLRSKDTPRLQHTFK
ncbi:WbqC family protein [Aquabacterium sp. A7-Y]|uniref:WbqC family protein n=1 Tax=Aquabacterium sp. A7-Y TaxID=1349605 RepID=UPI00223E88C5|nr:WbqC family protein [Aquabacterium sp. A7-Y]MCW7536784.1 WbqC family protein [Aquabacterium sp. A7-Y]